MNNDGLRTSLVTQLVCAQCGNYLTMSYDKPKEPRASDSNHLEASDGITGAAKVQVNIYVHPCKKCYSKATEPIRMLKSALKDIEGMQS